MTDAAGRAARDGRHRRLLADLAGLKSAVLAFSGGLDSSFLLHAASQAMPSMPWANTSGMPALRAKSVSI